MEGMKVGPEGAKREKFLEFVNFISALPIGFGVVDDHAGCLAL